MNYVDGFVVPVPRAKRAEYEKLAELGAAVFRDHGATRVVECWEDDITPGTLTGFDLSVKREADEAVVFSWIEWPDKESRDAGTKSAMSDPRFTQMDMNNMPFNGKRMIFGGFQKMVER